MGGKIDFNKIKTYSAKNRKNLVCREDLLEPGSHVPGKWVNPEIDELAGRIMEAHKKGRPVVWSIGAHVIKCGLSLYLVEFMKKGFISHLAGNGAVSIHDFELACLGGTSEDVASALEDGTFGMWEETGAWMNEAIKSGYSGGLGYGESLGRYMTINERRFPWKDISVIYNAFKLGIPATFHVGLGTDIIHQHPSVDFSAIGGASGVDFKIYCESITGLEEGIFLNFGSSVIGPEVFLKALSIARNLGFKVRNFTTANFDLIELGDYRSPGAPCVYHYFYRPRKNIVNRPVSMGGKGFHFNVNHGVSIPCLYRKLTGEDL